MQPKPLHWDTLPKGTPERAIARIANIANVNTVLGGFSALVKANRAMAMNLPHAYDLADAVDRTYSASTGSPSPDHRAWECPECGTACLGYDAAREHCYDLDDDGHIVELDHDDVDLY